MAVYAVVATGPSASLENVQTLLPLDEQPEGACGAIATGGVHLASSVKPARRGFPRRAWRKPCRPSAPWMNIATLNSPAALPSLVRWTLPVRLGHSLPQPANWFRIASRHFFYELTLGQTRFEFAIGTNFVLGNLCHQFAICDWRRWPANPSTTCSRGFTHHSNR